MVATKRIKRALVSVFHKDGLDEILKKLHNEGVSFVSTGGTQSFIESLGLPCDAVEDLTTYPSILGGRVKTLHPKIHAGLLSVRSNPDHMRQIEELDIETIDMVVVNLYPFKKTIEKPGVTLEEAIETIDKCMEDILKEVLSNDYTMIVTADHGNSECMINPDGSINTAHTTNLVPLSIVNYQESITLNKGKLSDIAPTILDIMDIEKPVEMIGVSLIK